MADDKKDLKPEEQTKNGPAAPKQQPSGKDAPPVKEAAGSPPAKEAPAPEKDSGPKREKTEAAGRADTSRPGNVIDISGAMIDKIVAEKEKAAKVAEAGKEQPAEPAKTEQKEKKEPEKQAGRAPKAVKKAPEKSDKPPAAKKAEPKKEAPAPEKPKEPEKPAGPVAAPRSGEPEQIVHINLSELHAFKNHPFQVRDDEEMRAMVASVKDKGVTQPAIVRPREGSGYEIVSGHRRQKASQLAGYLDMSCIVRNLTDEQAITQMVEDNTNQRGNILPSERVKALKMQLEAIKHQGARETSGQIDPKIDGLFRLLYT